MEKKMILFDLDGTLWDSSKQVAESWTLAIQKIAPETGIVITKDFMHRAMGKVMDEIKNMMFEEAAVKLDSKRQDEIYEACSLYEIEYITEHGGDIFDGVEKTLATLAKKYKLGIVSNCQCGYIEAFLTYSGFGKYISELECYGNTNMPKWDNICLVVERNVFSKEEVLYLGDTRGDYDSAKKAGVEFVHAAYGFGVVPDDVKKIKSFEEILQVL